MISVSNVFFQYVQISSGCCTLFILHVTLFSCLHLKKSKKKLLLHMKIRSTLIIDFKYAYKHISRNKAPSRISVSDGDEFLNTFCAVVRYISS